MNKFFLLLTCSLLIGFLGLTLQAEPEQIPGDSPTVAKAMASTAEPKLEEQRQDAQTEQAQKIELVAETRSALAENSTEPAEKPAATPAPKREFRKLTSGELAAQYTASCLFGALTGTGCHFVEKHNLADLHGPWSWLLEYAIRAGVLRTVEEDMQSNRDVALAPGAFKIAWASSWIAYLTAKCVA